MNFEYAILAALIAYLISRLAKQKGFYILPSENEGPYGDIAARVVKWELVSGAFGLFLAIELIVVPALYFLGKALLQWQGIDAAHFISNFHMQGWVNLIGAVLTAVAIKIYYSMLSPAIKQAIFGKESSNRNVIVNWLMGSLTWLIAYPWVISIGQFIAGLRELTSGPSNIDQVAVSEVKKSLDSPTLFVFTVICVVIIIPILEEILFRGFLQAGLKGILGRTKAIVITSIIFSVFHYSAQQGLENIELLIVLFILSCYLGFIRERQKSLWASIGLHSTFNLVSILMIFLMDKWS